jgi:hypothetical protein
MVNHLDSFRKEFLDANTWSQRREGIPLELLDNLSKEELSIAADELLAAVDVNDTWPTLGLGHIKSTKALPRLYEVLGKTERAVKITTAYAIFQICQDQQMIAIVLQELPRTKNIYELISVLYLLPNFKDDKILSLLNDYRRHKDYLVAYNATVALGLSTDTVVRKFRS